MPANGHDIPNKSATDRRVDTITPINQHTSGLEQARIRVLHVDDEPDFADVAADFLERAGDEFSVVTETSADDGLGRLAEEPVDCVVSDYQMPGRDGLEFLVEARDEYSDLPFILFTGRGSEEIASDAIAKGVTDYLQKEAGTGQYEVLANRIRNAVDQYRTEQELRTTLSWYQRLVEQELAGIYLIQDEAFIYVNAKLADIFGYTQEELIGCSPRTVIAEADHEDLVENLRQREAGEVDNIRYELTGERKDGRAIDLDVHGGVIEFEGDPAVLGILLDTTDRD
jgi:PAS domain S-box-containing protein